MLKTALLGALLVPATCIGGTLTATTRNDAEGGIFLNLTTAAHQLWTTPGLTVTVDVAPGSYIGFDSSEVGQTLRETLAAIGAGSSISQNTGGNLNIFGNAARNGFAPLTGIARLRHNQRQDRMYRHSSKIDTILAQ